MLQSTRLTLWLTNGFDLQFENMARLMLWGENLGHGAGWLWGELACWSWQSWDCKAQVLHDHSQCVQLPQNLWNSGSGKGCKIWAQVNRGEDVTRCLIGGESEGNLRGSIFLWVEECWWFRRNLIILPGSQTHDLKHSRAAGTGGKFLSMNSFFWQIFIRHKLTQYWTRILLSPVLFFLKHPSQSKTWC